MRFPFYIIAFSLSILMFLLTNIPIKGCIFGFFGEDYRVALLNPYVIGNDYASFFYSAEYLNDAKNTKKGKDRLRNCQEWADYMGNDVSAADVFAFLYKTSLDDVLNALEEGADNKRFGANSFFLTLLEKDKKEVLDYLLFAKEYEYASSEIEEDPWAAWTSQERPAVKTDEAFKTQALERFADTKDEWLRLRYAYQIVVLSRYTNDRETFNRFFNDFFAENTSSMLANWAFHHKAAMVSSKAESDYIYAQSFEKCPEKRMVAYHRFDKNLVEEMLTFAENNQEKAAIWALFETKNPGRSLDNIKKIYQLNPQNGTLPLLLVREVNKLEDWLLGKATPLSGTAVSPDDYNNPDNLWRLSEQEKARYRQLNHNKDIQYLRALSNFVEKIRTSNTPSALSDNLLHLLTAHLFLLDKKPSKAAPLLAKTTPDNLAMQEQKITEEILLLLYEKDISQPKVQEQLASLLFKLKENDFQNPNAKRDFEALNLLIWDAFMKKKDWVSATFLFNHSINFPKSNNYGSSYYALIEFLDWQATEDEIDAIITLIQKPNKSKFEQYLTSAYLPSFNALYDVQGTIALRKNDLIRAEQAFAKIDSSFWLTSYEFSHYLNSSPFDIFHQEAVKFPATKTAVVRQMISLEETAAQQPEKVAESYYELAKAWFNFSRHGENWMMLAYGQPEGSLFDKSLDSYGKLQHISNRKELEENYFSFKRSIEYLDKAEQAAIVDKDKEVLSKITFLRGMINYFLSEWSDNDVVICKSKFLCLENWADNYEETTYFQRIIVGCPELERYFGN